MRSARTLDATNRFSYANQQTVSTNCSKSRQNKPAAFRKTKSLLRAASLISTVLLLQASSTVSHAVQGSLVHRHRIALTKQEEQVGQRESIVCTFLDSNSVV